jgi:hypothetical protein
MEVCKVLVLLGIIAYECYDVIFDTLVAIRYKSGKTLHLANPNHGAAIGFILLATFGVLTSLIKIILCCYEYSSEKSDDKDDECNCSLTMKSVVLLFEDVPQAVMSYYFITRCAVDFDSIWKIGFLCVSPFLSLCFFGAPVLKKAYRTSNCTLRVFLFFLLLINLIPFVYGALTIKVARERTHLKGSVPQVVVAERTGKKRETDLCEVWKVIHKDTKGCLTKAIDCTGIFDTCSSSTVGFTLCYDKEEHNIVYSADVPLEGIGLKYDTNFCGDDKPKEDHEKVQSLNKSMARKFGYALPSFVSGLLIAFFFSF